MVNPPYRIGKCRSVVAATWRRFFYLSFLIITRVVAKESIIIKIDNISKSVMMITPFLL